MLKQCLAWFGSTRAGAWTIINLGTKVDRWLIKQTNGKFNSTFAWPCLLLTTKGAKSGKSRTVALLYLREEDNLVLIGSKGGNLKHPSWYINLRANPKVQVYINGIESEYIASEAQGEERERYWSRALEVYTGYEKYQKRAGDREIPVIVLTPVESYV